METKGKKVKNKQVYLNLISSVLSMIVSLGISFFLTPYIVGKIGSDAYGFVGLANNFRQYASIVTAALNSMAGRYIAVSFHKKDIDSAAKYISSVFVANIVLACIISCIFGWLVVNLNQVVQISDAILPDVRLLWSFIFISFSITLIESAFSCATFTKNRLDISSKINIGIHFLRMILLVSLFGLFKPSVWYLGFTTFICSLVSCGLKYGIFKRLLPEIQIKWEYVEIKKIRTLISSGVWNSISELSSILLEELDLLITNLFVSAACMGVVSVAKSLPSQLLSFFVLFGNAYSPQITLNYAQNKFEEVKEDVISAIRMVSFFSSIPMVCLYIYGKDFFQLWMPSIDTNQLFIICVLACLEFPLVVPLEPIWKVFVAANKTKQTAFVAIITAIASVSLTFLLLSMAQTDLQKMCVVVGVSSCIGLLRGGLFLPLYGAHCIHAKWTTFYTVLIKNVICIVVGCLLAFGLHKIFIVQSWLSLISSIFVVIIVMCFINTFFLLTKKEREVLIKKMRRI